MILTLDFETHYDKKEYSLEKMSEVEYILDPRFEVIMCALKMGRGRSVTYVGHDAIAAALAQVDWEKVALLAHNTRFDGSILAWHFGHVPRLYLDTMSMARATTHWYIGKSGLKQVSEYLALPPKGDAVIRASGKRLIDFQLDNLQEYQEYCIQDNDNCYEIFHILRPRFTAHELEVIDTTLRMFILPQVQLDRRVLEAHAGEVRTEKEAALAAVAGIDKSVFSSNVKFPELLATYGVEVPVKRSPTTGELIPAIARNDWEFKELCADDSQPPIVQAILATRLSVKSTIDETRAESFLNLTRIAWPRRVPDMHWAPVPLKFSGARTHRLSGDGGTNWQNIRRGSTLRRAIRAPHGYRIIHRDASQIEARMVAWLAWCRPLLDAFAQGRDVYSEFATIVYDREITKSDILERFVGKTGILGLGYGCGAAKFRHMLFANSTGISHKINLDEAEHIVNRYRAEYPEIVELWQACGVLLERMIEPTQRMRPLARARGRVEGIIDHLPVDPVIDSLWLPNGLCMSYPNLRHYRSEDDLHKGIEICYDDLYQSPSKIYGAKLTENISQALARIVVTEIIIRMRKITGYTPWLSTHDSLDYCVPETDAEDINLELERQFALVPDWCPGLPLASEGGWGVTLLDAERGVNQ